MLLLVGCVAYLLGLIVGMVDVWLIGAGMMVLSFVCASTLSVKRVISRRRYVEGDTDEYRHPQSIYESHDDECDIASTGIIEIMDSGCKGCELLMTTEGHKFYKCIGQC